MSRLSESLDRAVGDVRSRFSADELERRVQRNRERRRVRRVVTACAVVVALLAGVMVWARGIERGRITGTPGVFPFKTDTVLVFDDGYDGVALVDLDRRLAVRRVLEGQRAGDQPYRVIRAGDSLITGGGVVYATPLDGSTPRRLGPMFAIPSSNEERVWLVELAERGGEIDWQARPRLREVEVSGRVLTDVVAPRAGFPALGLPEGLAYETETGVLLWNAHERRVTGRLGSGRQAFVSDLLGGRLAWCEGDCREMRVTRLGARSTVTVSPPAGAEAYDARGARLSPDGRLLATIAGAAGPVSPESRWTLALVDTATGRSSTIGSGAPGVGVYAAWAPDGGRVFFSGYSYQRSETWVGVYDLGREEFHAVTLPFGGNLSFVPLERAEAERLMDAPPRGEEDCGPPSNQPSGRTEPCGFRFAATDLGAEERSVRDVVSEFGDRLQQVSLMAPTAGDQLERAYAPFVTSSLLRSWQSDPSRAPGRLTSSPWPDRIEVTTVEPLSRNSYRVSGEVVYETSQGVAGREPIALTVVRLDKGWRIDEIER